MFWVAASMVLAGVLSGFFAGASYQATGGGLASMVGGVIVGLLAGLSQTKPQDIGAAQISTLGQLFCLFQVSLLASYIFSNRLRKKGYFKWFIG